MPCVLEVMGYLHGLDEEPPVFDSGDIRADLIAQLQYQPAVDRQALREKMTPHLIAYASRNRAMGVVWRPRVVEPARVALNNMITRGEKRGDLRPASTRKSALPCCSARSIATCS